MFGPDHVYEGLVYVPLAVKLTLDPTQVFIVLLTVGDGGKAIPVTLVVVGLKLHPAKLTDKVYKPVSPIARFAFTVFCRFEVKPFGPVHE